MQALLNEFENERIKIKKELRTFNLVILILIILGIVLFFFGGIWSFIGAILLIVAMIIFSLGVSRKKAFQSQIKTKLMVSLVKEELGEDASYNVNGGLSLNEIISLGVCQSPDRYRMEDHVRATYKGVPYEMCDCHFEQKNVTHTNGRTQVTYVTYFKGRVIKIDYQRKLGLVMKLIDRALPGLNLLGLERLETEVIDFNKTFKCYVNDKIKAFYVLTPYLISKIMELEKMYAGGMCLVFKHDNLYILINDGSNSLEFNIDKPIDEKQIDKICSDLLLPSSVINEFRLDADKFNVDHDI